MACQVFISHSSADASWVNWIAAQSRALGIVPYLAEHDPQPGTVLSQKVRSAIAESVAVIVLLTANSMDSPYVHQEIGVAIEQGKLVVPLVDPAIVGRSLAMLDGLEYIAFDFLNLAPGATALLERLQAIGAEAQRRQVADRRQELVDGLVIAAAIIALIVLLSQAPEA